LEVSRNWLDAAAMSVLVKSLRSNKTLTELSALQMWTPDLHPDRKLTAPPHQNITASASAALPGCVVGDDGDIGAHLKESWRSVLEESVKVNLTLSKLRFSFMARARADALPPTNVFDLSLPDGSSAVAVNVDLHSAPNIATAIARNHVSLPLSLSLSPAFAV
jgi:hypothetical protein